MTQQDLRFQALSDWLNTVLSNQNFRITTASADASFRRYFRIHTEDDSFIAMDAPPPQENIEPFMKIDSFLYQHNVHVPKIYAQENKLGFLLLEDLGDTPYLSILNQDNATELYQTAIDEMISMQQAPLESFDLPNYDSVRLNDEMQLFPNWFLTYHLALEAPNCLDSVFKLLIDNAYQQPWHFVHRDYHSRNLMVSGEQGIGVIDFQDAVKGPVSYDLVSLLRDCYIQWPTEQVDEWIKYYYESAKSAQLLNCDLATFKRWFDLMGLQRHLKVLGIFCRLNYRDGKAGYMKDLPLTLKYVLQVTKTYPELAEFHEFLTGSASIMDIQQ